MTRALVLGGTGHIGAHVVRALLANGYTVRATFRNPRTRFVLDGLPVELTPANLDRPDELRRAADGCEWVFHCAGYYPAFTDRREPAMARGVAHVRTVFDVLKDCRPQRIVYTSSAATIAPQADRPATELDREPWPLQHWRPLYATVKVAMEHAVMHYVSEAGLPIMIVNPSVCIGEYDAKPFSGRLVLLFARGRMPAYLDHHLNAIDTADVGMGHVLAAERGRIGELYLLAHRNLSLLEFATIVANEAGVSPPRWRVPYALAMAAAVGSEAVAAVTRTEPLLPRHALQSARLRQCLDGSKARRELGLPQTPLEDAIHRALAWFRQHGYVSRSRRAA